MFSNRYLIYRPYGDDFLMGYCLKKRTSATAWTDTPEHAMKFFSINQANYHLRRLSKQHPLHVVEFSESGTQYCVVLPTPV
jgi:hypothetical protein